MTVVTQAAAPAAPVRNKRLFYAIARRIERQPRRYKQSLWGEGTNAEHPCGTAHCIAGWAMSVCGCKFRYDRWQDISEALTPRGKPLMSGTGYSIYAARRLGLTDTERKIMFDGHWIPARGLSVPDALRRFADGASLRDVTDPGRYRHIALGRGLDID